MRHIKSTIMTMLAALMALPVSARDFEYQGLTYTVLDENALTCETKEGTYSIEESKYVAGNDVSGAIEIPATVSDGSKAYSVVKIGDYSFARSSVSSVVLPSTITTIGTKAFVSCFELTSVNFPESITSIEPYAFQYSSINNVVLPPSLTSIEVGVFYYCGSLNNIEFPETITSIGDYAFYESSSTNHSFKFPPRLERIGDYAFAGSGVVEADLPETLKYIGVEAFADGHGNYSSSSLCFLTLPASIETIEDFAFRKSLYELRVTYNAEKPKEFSGSIFNDETYWREKLIMPNASLADIKATAPWNRFRHVEAKDGTLEPLEDADFEYGGLMYTIIDKEAKTCKTQEDWVPNNEIDPAIFANGLEIPAIVSDGTDNYTVVAIGRQTFSGCRDLTSVTLPETIQGIEHNAFAWCTNLSSINFPESLRYIEQNAFQETALETIALPDRMTYLPNNAFAGCKSLNSVNLPQGLTGIGRSAFGDCGNMKTIEFPSSLSVISNNAFSAIPFETLSFPQSLKIIGVYNFGYYKGTDLILPESLKIMGEGAFSGCQNLTSITLPASLEYMGQEVFTRSKLKEITYKASQPITAWPDIFYVEGFEQSYQYNAFTDATLNMPNATLATAESVLPWSLFDRIYASDGEKDPGLVNGKDFEYDGLVFTVIDNEAKTCRTKTGNLYFGTYTPGNEATGDLVIPATAKLGVNEYTVVEIGQFGFVQQPVTSVSIPETVKIIEGSAFRYCNELTSIELPESVTTLADGALADCGAMTSVVLPASLDSIGAGVFSYTRNLTSVTYNAANPVASNWYIFEPEIYENATLFMPNATLETVQSVEPWMDFKKIIAMDGSVGFGPGVGEDFEYEGIIYTVISVENATCRTKAGGGYNEEGLILGNRWEGDLAIPSRVSDGTREYTVVEIGDYSFAESTGITSLELPETITTIGTQAFNFCTGLTSVMLPESVTAIGAMAFSNCRLLSSITLPASLVSFGESCFGSCVQDVTVTYNAAEPSTAPESIFEPAYETGTLHTPNATLAAVQATTPWNKFLRITASDGTVEPGVGVGEDFEYDGIWYTVLNANDKTCRTKEGTGDTQLANHPYYVAGNTVTGDIVIPAKVMNGSDEYTVVEIGHRGFCNLPELRSVKLPETVQTIGTFAFCGDSGLESVNIPEGISVIQWYLFNGCSSLKSINLPASLTLIREHAFAGCTSLQSIVIPESVTAFESSVFTDCSSLTSIQLPKEMEFNGYYVFQGCTSLKDINIPESLTSIGISMFKDCRSLTEIALPKSLKEIEADAFAGCSGLESLILPEGLESVNSYAFENCSSLQSLQLPASLSSIGEGVFSGCGRLSEIEYAAEKPVSAEENIFDADVYTIATLLTPNATLAAVQATSPWNKFLRITASNGTIEPGVGVGEDFEYDGVWYTVISTEAKTCKTKDGRQVGDVYVPGTDYKGDLVIPEKVFNGSSEYTVIEIGRYGFANATSITSVIIPETITRLPESAFSGCVNLTSASIPESVTTIYIYAFYKCAALNDIKLPKGLTKIGYDAFLGCESLTSIVIPEGVTRIEDQSFGQCSSLREIDIPAGVEEFESAAFSGCASDASITYRAATPVAASDNLFSGAYQNGTLHMPNATLDAVQATSPWNKFLHITASDGSIEPGPGVGLDIVVDGLTFTVIDENEYLLSTKEGAGASEGAWGNFKTGHLVIPETVSYNGHTYTVTTIGNYGFCYNTDLLSITIPGTVTGFGLESFYGCERLTSLVWQGHTPLSSGVVEGTGNPNLLLYVDSVEFAPTRMDHNIVADGRCTNLVLTPGYAFSPLYAFTADHSEITKAFTQETPIDGCAGWETLAIPFRPTDIRANDGRRLVPFDALVDTDTECPFWLYEADAAGEWKTASAILQGVPYLISMPNNDTYDEEFRVNGDVTFSTDEQTYITPETCTPYATTWATGREFRSLWLPLQDEERFNAMGLNVGISDLTDDDGQQLAPGSAFHADIVPLPMEAYVTRIDGRRSMPVVGDKNLVGMMAAEDGLRIAVDFGSIILCSDRNRTVEVFTTDGIAIRKVALKAGETLRIEHLTRGIYIVAGRKVTVR